MACAMCRSQLRTGIPTVTIGSIDLTVKSTDTADMLLVDMVNSEPSHGPWLLYQPVDFFAGIGPYLCAPDQGACSAVPCSLREVAANPVSSAESRTRK